MAACAKWARVGDGCSCPFPLLDEAQVLRGLPIGSVMKGTGAHNPHPEPGCAQPPRAMDRAGSSRSASLSARGGRPGRSHRPRPPIRSILPLPPSPTYENACADGRDAGGMRHLQPIDQRSALAEGFRANGWNCWPAAAPPRRRTSPADPGAKNVTQTIAHPQRGVKRDQLRNDHLPSVGRRKPKSFCGAGLAEQHRARCGSPRRG